MKYSSISLALLALLGTGSALAEAGRFQFVHGEVSVTHPNGSQTAAHKGDLVDEGDTIATGALAQAQLIMQDEGLIALRPDSRLRIDTYRFSGKADGSEQGVFALIKGGFRSITGWIGREPHGVAKADCGTVRDGVFAEQVVHLFDELAGAAGSGPWLTVASFVNPHDIAFAGGFYELLLGFEPGDERGTARRLRT